VEAGVKDQFAAGERSTVGATICAGDVLSPANSTSVPAMMKFAENPAPTEPNPAARPAIGWRPTAMNSIAASGGITIAADSEATLEMMPTRTTTKVRIRG